MISLILSISGLPGAGKSTIAKVLAEKLGFKHFYMGGIIRDLAKKQGLTLSEFYAKNMEVDKMIDSYLAKLGKKQDNFVVESRTAFHFIPDSIKIYLNIDLRVGAERIFKELKEANERNEKACTNVDEALEGIKKRLKTEAEHYSKLYNLNVHDKSHYDFVLDTTNLTVEEVLEKLLNFIKRYNK